ncbi:hypothetical protein [Geminisphaera colitermitum]|nr:hypothetical protein [Geminisphaera colitermitum]
MDRFLGGIAASHDCPERAHHQQTKLAISRGLPLKQKLDLR